MSEKGHISIKEMAEKGNISVKDVDMAIFLEIRSIATRNRMKMGDIVTQALKMWQEDYRKGERDQK